MNKENVVQECDATEDKLITKSWEQNKKLHEHRIKQIQ